MIRDMDIIVDGAERVTLLVPGHINKRKPLTLSLQDDSVTLHTENECISKVEHVGRKTIDLLSRSQNIDLIASPDAEKPSLDVSHSAAVKDERTVPSPVTQKKKGFFSRLLGRKENDSIIAPLSEREVDPAAGEKRRKYFSMAWNISKRAGTMMAVSSAIGFATGPLGVVAFSLGRRVYSGYKAHKEAEAAGQAQSPFFSLATLKKKMTDAGKGLKDSWTAFRSGPKGKWGQVARGLLPALSIGGLALTLVGLETALGDVFDGSEALASTFNEAAVPLPDIEDVAPEAANAAVLAEEASAAGQAFSVTLETLQQFAARIKDDVTGQLAKEALSRAVNGSDQALADLGYHFYNGDGVSQNIEWGREFYKLAADAHVPGAQENLDWINRVHPVPVSAVADLDEDVITAPLAAEHVTPAADAQVATMGVYDDTAPIIEADLPPETLSPLQRVQSLEYDITGRLAKEALARAVNGSDQALADLGYHLYNGDGVPRNIDLAKELYRMAADAHVPGAQENLDWINRIHPASDIGQVLDSQGGEEMLAAAAEPESVPVPNPNEIAACKVVNQPDGGFNVRCTVKDDVFDPGEKITVSDDFGRVSLELDENTPPQDTERFLNKFGLKRALDALMSRPEIASVAGSSGVSPVSLKL